MTDRVRELRAPARLEVGEQIELAAVVGPVAAAAQRDCAEPVAAPA